MSAVRPSSFLRRVLQADALVSGAVGALLAAGALWLSPRLGLPAPFLAIVGLALLPFAAGLWILASRERIGRALLWAVIGGNVLWSVASVVLVASGWLAPTLLGLAFMLVQAAVVLVFAELEYFGLRRGMRLGHAT
ncbi:hypothetical protein [Marinivivus vitaminiproducens]|uniref:hypothetical protein n=1 Tax=Marinivivus vitaminiproducens TaxID=3035935 RepID=UPI00279F5549|nr:hypothetical protein P4R82_18170 [Geminicoccaceae bacterium SCSIO 64248]